jgi:GNAT superfamily N-acetyltransferase
MTVEYREMQSLGDEAHFFALMGSFFASAQVRRECGGYPLNDGPLYHWFVALDPEARSQVLGFISVEFRSDHARVRDGYVRPSARGRGLFRTLRGEVLDRVDGLGLPCIVRVRTSSLPFVGKHGFAVQFSRGDWLQLQRPAHERS